MKKIIIGFFATIGVLSVLACLVGIGYILGTGTDLGTIISADRGASTGNIVENITPTPGGTQTPSQTPATNPAVPTPPLENTYSGFEPDSIKVVDNTIQVDRGLIESMRNLPQYEDYTDEELANFLGAIAGELLECETNQEMFNRIDRYKDKDMLDAITGRAQSQVIPTSTPMPTELPKQEDLTFTKFENIYERTRFSLVDLPVWSEATDFGKKVGVIKADHVTVVVESVCNETGYYHVLYVGPTDTEFNEGYIHPDHFRYLTTAEEEYNKKVEAGLINPDEIPSNTPSTEAPTPAPTAKPTETPSESSTQKPTETPSKPTETPAKPTTKPTATPTPKPSTPSATDYDSYKIKYKYFKDYITGYTDEGYPILPDGNILTPTTTPETLGYNPATIDGYTEEGYVIIGGTPWIPRDWENWGDSSDGGTINPDFDYSGSGIH